MLKPDRDSTMFNTVNALQPVMRNTSAGLFDFDRQMQTDTAMLILQTLTNCRSYERRLTDFIRIKSVLRIVQFDQGTVRYGVHIEYQSHVKTNVVRIFNEYKTDAFDIYFIQCKEDRADLLAVKLNICGALLQDTFEINTGLLLSL